jgi:DNA-binding protein HU-beta
VDSTKSSEGLVNKAELIDTIAVRLGDNRKTASEAVEAVIDTITRTVAKGEKVAITGFGIFEKIERAARVARNPATGAKVRVKKTSVPKFRPGTQLKAVVSGATKLAPLPKAPVKAAVKTAVKAAPVKRVTAAAAKKAAPVKRVTAAAKKAAPVKAAPDKAAPAKAVAAKKAVPAKKAAPVKKVAAVKKAPAKAPVKAPVKRVAKKV